MYKEFNERLADILLRTEKIKIKDVKKFPEIKQVGEFLNKHGHIKSEDDLKKYFLNFTITFVLNRLLKLAEESVQTLEKYYGQPEE